MKSASAMLHIVHAAGALNYDSGRPTQPYSHLFRPFKALRFNFAVLRIDVLTMYGSGLLRVAVGSGIWTGNAV